MITKDAHIQLTAVEYGTLFGDTTYGMYSHTTGPKESPNDKIKTKIPNRSIDSP